LGQEFRHDRRVRSEPEAAGKPPSRARRRAEWVGRLKQVVAKRKSRNQVEELLAELEGWL
jgi:methylphosphotriester-DNA--protein-cysteine methyltransferase